MLDNKDRKMPAAFYRLWAGEGVSALAGSWGTMANSWLVYQWTGSPAAIGTMWLFYFLPSLLIQWGVGPYLDRWDRSQLLSWCQWSRSLAFLLPLGCIWAQWEASWLLYLTVAWTGTVQALYTPSTQALLPALVQQTSLTQANARIDATFRLMNMIGPIMGGGAVAAAGVEINLIGVVIFYAWGGWILSRLPSVRNQETTTLPSWKKGIREGFHVFTRDPVLIVLTGCLAVIQWAVAVLIVLGLPYVTDEMNRGALAYGWFLAGFSIGYLLGSMGVSRWKGGRPLPAVMVGANCVGGATFIGLAVAPHFGWALVMEGLAGFCAPFFHVHCLRLFQTRVPSHVRGQVFSLRVLVMRLVMPLGTVMAGWMGSVWGIRVTLAVVGVVVVLVSLAGWRWFVRQKEPESIPSVRMFS